MERGLVIAFRILELRALGQHNLVPRHAVVGPVPVDFADLHTVRLDDFLHVLLRFPLRSGRRPLGEFQALGLLDVEHGVAFPHGPRCPLGIRILAAVFGPLAWGGFGAVGPHRRFVNEDRGAPFAFPYLPPGLFDLVVGAPAVIVPGAPGALDHQLQRIPALIARARREVLRHAVFTGLPVFLPRRGATLDLFDDVVGKLLVILFGACLLAHGPPSGRFVFLLGRGCLLEEPHRFIVPETGIQTVTPVLCHLQRGPSLVVSDVRDRLRPEASAR